ncbi:MAG TPA: hypothetical protein VEZ46_10595 [Mycobacteriales bacterium]|jgi:hypothetical protein|nr:hypothetical protein [Mycobacteriales bacterium]
MSRTTRLLAAASLAAVTAFASVAPASAAPSGDPSVTRTANAAHACASIPATLAQFGLEAEGFSYRECVRELAGRVPLTGWGGNSYEQCAMLEAGVETPGGFFQITYPYTFHAEPGDLFPDLRAYDREQCARALWTFHEIASHMPPEE